MIPPSTQSGTSDRLCSPGQRPQLTSFPVPSQNFSLVEEPSLVPKEIVTRYRKGGPKSRNACIVCKIRRVKCDETKPLCTRCTSTGRKCEGYAAAAPSKPVKRGVVPLLPSPPAVNPKKRTLDMFPISILPNPSVDLTGSYSERRSFYYFRTLHMSDSPGNFEPHFWESSVLQFSHRYPAVKQSLITLSAIYEEYERNASSENPGVVKYSEVTIQQYNRAVRELVQYLATGEQDTTVALISCLIFVWIEFLQGDLKTGIQHLQSGLKILLSHSSSQSTHIADINDINASLDRSFSRLQLQVEIHGGMPADFRSLARTNRESFPPIPSSFSNIFEAREWMDRELGSAINFLHGPPDSKSTDPKMDDHTIENTRLRYLQRFNKWSEATERMTAESIPLEGHPYSSGALYLQLYYTCAIIIFNTVGRTSEMDYDEHLLNFERLCYLSENIMKSARSGAHMLSFDMCIVPPLFFLVLKCRDIRLRTRAISLLELAPYQEGMWRRDDILKWCRWKMETEEHGRGEISAAEPLPESARIADTGQYLGDPDDLPEAVDDEEYRVSQKSVDWYSRRMYRL